MKYLKTAIEAARLAGRVHKKYFGRGNIGLKSKTSSYDLLTKADTEAEKAAVGLIKNKFPDHNFLCEENSYRGTDSQYCWVIDPLDGTNNFACGLPIFCSSVALARNNDLLAGAIYDVTRDELFYAAKGKGAFLNGKRIHVNRARSLKESLIITGFYYSRGKEMVETLETIKRLHYEKILGIRRLGAAALDLAYVAAGRAAAFWEFELSPWDYCAGKLIVEEAGGRVTGKSGNGISLKKKNFIVATNSLMHRRLIKVIKNVHIRPFSFKK